jgi:cytochrome b561
MNSRIAEGEPGFQYDRRTIGLHWVTVVLVVALWCLGQTIDWFPRGAPRIAARSCHITIGATLLLVLAVRLWWRATAGRRLPQALKDRSQAIASALHGLLYLLVLAAVALGVANVWTRGDTWFHLLTVPQFDPGNKDLVERVEDLHALAANVLAATAALHAAMALVHHHILKDGVLRRMLPRR